MSGLMSPRRRPAGTPPPRSPTGRVTGAAGPGRGGDRPHRLGGLGPSARRSPVPD